MTLRLNGSTSGYSEIDAPAIAGNNTITLPSANGAANQLLKNGAAAGSLEFTNDVVVDGSGRLLVGTSSDTEATTALLQGTSAGSTNPAVLRICRGSTPTATQTLGTITWGDTGHSTAASIAAARDSGTWTSGVSQPSALTFSTTASGASSTTERMRITNTGIVSIGIVNPTSSFSDGNGVQFSPVGAIISNRTSANSAAFGRNTTTGDVIEFRYGSTPTNTGGVGSISVTASTTAYNTSSDHRLKENVVSLSGAIDRLQQIPVHRFNFIADPDNTVDGFIAHEAQAVVPECVTGTKDEVDADGNPVYQGIDQSKLVPLLTAALQEAIGRIETLEAEVAALKAS